MSLKSQVSSLKSADSLQSSVSSLKSEHGQASGDWRPKTRDWRLCAAFTLIELMVVVSIMGLVMAMGLPSILRAFHREALRKAVWEVQEVCSHARARAILQGTMTEVVFHAQDGRLELAGAGAAPPSGGEATAAPPPSPAVPSGSGLSAQFPDKVALALLKINGVSYMEADVARVRFYPNGTCDELRLILLRPDTGQYQGVFLEVTTGLAFLESDPNKLLAELR